MSRIVSTLDYQSTYIHLKLPKVIYSQFMLLVHLDADAQKSTRGKIHIPFHFSLSTEKEKTIIVFGSKVLLVLIVLC